MKKFIPFWFFSMILPGVCFPQDSTMIRNDLWLVNQPGFLLGSLLVVTGIATGLVFLVRRRSSELHFLYLAIFIFGYGLRVVAGNDLVVLSVQVPRIFWEYVTAAVTAVIPVFFILFLQSFTGRGWKNSVYWLMLAWIAFAIISVAFGFITGDPYFLTGTILNNIMVLLIVAIFGLNRYLSRRKSTPEGRTIEAGLFVFIAAVLYNNLAPKGSIPDGTMVEEASFFIFVCCLIYAAIRRSSQTERQYQAIVHDLETARQIQLSILPAEAPVSSSCAVYPTYLPATIIGGDFYTFHQADDRHIGLLVADVSGHGIPAALLASMIRVAFSSHATKAASPSELLGAVNSALTGQLNNEFITVAYLWFDFERMTVCHSSAGHPAPVLVRSGEADDKPFPAKGIPIGISAGYAYTEAVTWLLHGDRVVVYTDGLTEVFNPRGELFGKKRLFAGLEESTRMSGTAIADHLLGKVIAWSGKNRSGSMDDDITMIVVDIL